jgi:hypothetical protein
MFGLNMTLEYFVQYKGRVVCKVKQSDGKEEAAHCVATGCSTVGSLPVGYFLTSPPCSH